MLGGRGAGKTRAGAEWVRAQARAACLMRTRPRGIALVGETWHDVREVMIEGPSGLLRLVPRTRAAAMEPSRAAAGMAERRGGARLLGGRPGQSARAAIRRRLVRRTGQVALCRRRPSTCCNSACGWGSGRAN